MLKIIFSSPSWIQEFFQRRRTEQVELDELEKLLHGHPDAAGEVVPLVRTENSGSLACLFSHQAAFTNP